MLLNIADIAIFLFGLIFLVLSVRISFEEYFSCIIANPRDFLVVVISIIPRLLWLFLCVLFNFTINLNKISIDIVHYNKIHVRLISSNYLITISKKLISLILLIITKLIPVFLNFNLDILFAFWYTIISCQPEYLRQQI